MVKTKALAVVLSVVALGTTLAFVMPSKAGIFDDIVTAVEGHIDDINGRLADDEFVTGETIKAGMFREDDDGQDFVHRGGGAVSVVRNDSGVYIQLEESFWSTPGPDYHVYISSTRGITNEESFYRAETTELGKLTKGSGASYYRVPDGVDVQSVTIWCKRFGEFIASADVN